MGCCSTWQLLNTVGKQKTNLATKIEDFKTLNITDWSARKNTSCYAVETTKTAIFRNSFFPWTIIEGNNLEDSTVCTETVKRFRLVFCPVLSSLKRNKNLISALPIFHWCFYQSWALPTVQFIKIKSASKSASFYDFFIGILYNKNYTGLFFVLVMFFLGIV